MRQLSSTLLAAQQEATNVPYVKVEASTKLKSLATILVDNLISRSMSVSRFIASLDFLSVFW